MSWWVPKDLQTTWSTFTYDSGTESGRITLADSKVYDFRITQEYMNSHPQLVLELWGTDGRKLSGPMMEVTYGRFPRDAEDVEFRLRQAGILAHRLAS